MYRITRDQELHSAPIGVGHNSIVVVPGPTFGLASVGIKDESGNLMHWLMVDEPLEQAMAFAQNKSKPGDCWRCGGRSWLPNPDLMALLAECDVKDWEIQWRKGILHLIAGVIPTGKGYFCPIKIENDDFQSALTDAMFQATLTLEPDNQTTHFSDCQWLIGGDGFICACSASPTITRPAGRDNAKDR